MEEELVSHEELEATSIAIRQNAAELKQLKIADKIKERESYSRGQ